MIISQMDIDYIKNEIISNVTFENVGKPCKLFDCVQVKSKLDVYEILDSDKEQAENRYVWSCALGVVSLNEDKRNLRDRHLPKIQEMLKISFWDNVVIKNIVRDERDFYILTGMLLGSALEWIAYGDNPKYVWYRSMIPIFLAGHLVCGFAGKKKKLYFGYRPEPVYYIY